MGVKWNVFLESISTFFHLECRQNLRSSLFWFVSIVVKGEQVKNVTHLFSRLSCHQLIFSSDLFDSSRQSDLVWRPHRRKKIRFRMKLNPMPSDATLLAINSQNFCMLHVASVCTPCCMLLRVVGSCCVKFETIHTF